MSFRLYLLVACLLTLTAGAQTVTPLERLISVDLRNERIEDALKQIEQQGRFSFSYNPAILTGSRQVTLRLTNQPVRIVLTQLFRGSSVAFKTRGNYIILTQQETSSSEPTHFVVDGYILDELTGQRVVQASIYERTTLASAVSNPFGYYRLRLPTALPNVRLEVRKASYVSESVQLHQRQTQSLTIQLRPVIPPQPPQPVQASTKPVEIVPVATPVPIPDTTRPAIASTSVVVSAPDMSDTTLPARPSLTAWERTWLDFNDWFISAQHSVHNINLSRDTLYREWQVSLIPFIGTNHTLSGRIINGYSLNLLAGYSLGVRQLEVGGVLNMVRGDVTGVQVAGVGNVVGENVYGIQVGGTFNVVRRDMSGVQVGGIGNIVGGHTVGVQVGGTFNAVLGQTSGAQVAGTLNLNVGKVRGIQVAGLMNVGADDLDGWQVAGLMNIASGRVTNGWQIAGLVNYAHIVRKSGGQLGFINIADSSASTPIGFLSFVRRNGYQRLEFGANEAQLMSVSLKTGSRWFYNIFTAGVAPVPGNAQTAWQLGYGIGTNLVLKRHWALSVDVTGHHIGQFNGVYTEPNWMLRFTPTLELRFGRVALFGGPSLVAYHPSATGVDPLNQRTLWLSSRPQTTELTYTHNGWTGWLGFQTGIRLCGRR